MSRPTSFPFRAVLAAAALLACHGIASAQDSYVSASVLGDFVRSTHVDYPDLIEPAASGEAIGFALRAGTPLGTIWGVEVEYARPGEIEHESTPAAVPLAQPSAALANLGELPGVTTLVPEIFGPTILPYSIRTSARHSTLSTALWVQQQLTARVAMVYLGGMAFYRSEHEYEYQMTFPRLAGPAPLPPSLVVPAAFRSESVAYGVRPLAGIESRIGMTEHAHLTAGVRLQASSGMWLVRPSIGLGWMF
jgi:hypothetical protein